MSGGLSFSIDELERDLGIAARLTVLLNVGGQQRNIPQPAFAGRSALSNELGPEIAIWLAGRYGGTIVNFPSRTGSEQEEAASLLRAAVLDAGLTDPTVSANLLAKEHGVSARHVRRLRRQLRDEAGPAPLPLFDQL